MARAAPLTGQTGLPTGDLFQPLIADPTQPQFFAATLWVTSPRLVTQLASVGVGENIGLLRGSGGGWQVSVAAGVFSQFDLRRPSNDLVNTDYLVGLPFTWRHGDLSGRLQYYHHSSHLGDEYVLRTNPTRINLSFECLEALLADELGEFRVYGGGEILLRREPRDLNRLLLHGGVEWRGRRPAVRGHGAFFLAFDAKASQQRRWQLGMSGRAGIAFGSGSGRHWNLQLHGYSGPVPFSQFYEENIESVGVGLHFAL